jgi:serine-type D-Ala-D-Ala carboxypeptidase/endopeptidase (penicillin-binding protein 4)
MLLGPKRATAFILALAALWVCGPSSRAGTPLEERVDAVINAKGFEGGHWGLLVVDSATGKVVFERNSDKMFCPASVTKLYSSAAALMDLGANYRFKTPVVRKGEVKDGILRGDLIVVAKGDLSLGGRTGPDGTLAFEDNDHSYAGGNPDASLVPCDPLAGLNHLAREVLSSGITNITGDVLIDDRLFEHAPSTGSGPTRVSAIVVNDNVVDVVVTPGAKMGDPAKVRVVPETESVQVDARVDSTSGEGALIEIHAAGPRRFTVRGRIPVGHKPILKTYEVEDPASFARSLFIETLRARGVRVAASPLAENAADKLPSKAEVAALPMAAEYTSPPLREYIKVILKVSQNLHASTLPMLVAAKHGETTLAQGLKREADLLGKLGVDPRSVSFGGGAGGSRSDLVTPRSTVTLLRAMAARPDFPVYDSALPVLGRDGTLAKAVMPESTARGHARAKTGTFWVDNALDGRPILVSKALAGYLETSSGRKLTFAFFVNNVPSELIGGTVAEAAAAAGRRLGRLCEVFYSESPEATEVAPAPTPEPAKAGR